MTGPGRRGKESGAGISPIRFLARLNMWGGRTGSRGGNQLLHDRMDLLSFVVTELAEPVSDVGLTRAAHRRIVDAIAGLDLEARDRHFHRARVLRHHVRLGGGDYFTTF